ncbi:MAG TPA: histidine kinase [Desulfobacteraceae bacterium]|nr:histidine kinase [Desulfobacteraceae bacterium]
MPEVSQEYSSPSVFFSSNVASGALKILVPLYLTYFLFALGIFFFFIPEQHQQLIDEKKKAILQLTDSTISLLADYNARIKKGEIDPETARREAISQIRSLRYGNEGKDYFWINDYHPFMIMHPYRSELDGRDLTLFKDPAGNYPFVAMVDKVMREGAGFVSYHWQWQDTPEKILPKISYVKGFPEWGWIIGTGIYEHDIDREIDAITQKFIRIFAVILAFVLVLSLYIGIQVYRIERWRSAAEQARHLDQLRLKKLFELSQLSGHPMDTITKFALEEAVTLTGSAIGYLAFMNEDETELTMHTWSEQAMAQCTMGEKKRTYPISDTGLWARSARTRKPEVVNDYPSDTSLDKKGCPEGHVGITRMMNIPVFEDGRVVALAGVGNKPSDYDDSDTRQLQLMMDGMWTILKKSRAESRLRESEARYRVLADNATDVIWILEIAGFKFSYVSPAMKQLLGYTPEEFLKIRMGQHMTEASMKKVYRIITEELGRDTKQGIDPDRYRAIELELTDRRGQTVWTEVTARFLRSKEGTPDRIIGITRDITGRKALETKLREANTELCMAQQIAGIGSWSLDTETGRMNWSEEVYRLFECNPQDGPGHADTLKTVLTKEWRALFATAMTQAQEQGKPFELELKLNLPSARERWVHAICNPEPRSGGCHYLLRGTFQDITQRKQLESRIQQSQKLEALGTLAGGIAHDFNNILSAMMGFTELAKLRVKDNPDTCEKLDQVLAGGLRARELVKHILTFSRKADVQKSNIQVGILIKESLKFLRASLPPNIDIRQTLSSPEAVIHADPTQMHQVLMNLFTNAAHAMKEKGGLLDVSLSTLHIPKDMDVPELPPGPYVKLVVRDTGKGIPKDIQNKVFEPFFTTKPREEGSGMGLSMVYGIIREMKGVITVESEPGQGAAFQILLPVSKDETTVRPGESAPSLLKGKGRILLVDDESQIIRWTTLILMKLGYEVEAFETGAQALDAFQKTPDSFDLVLTDLAMPVMDGLTLAKQITTQRPDIPVVLCTGFSENLETDILKKSGVSALVMKPMIANELSTAVHNAMTTTGRTHAP